MPDPSHPPSKPAPLEYNGGYVCDTCNFAKTERCPAIAAMCETVNAIESEQRIRITSDFEREMCARELEVVNELIESRCRMMQIITRSIPCSCHSEMLTHEMLCKQFSSKVWARVELDAKVNDTVGITHARLKFILDSVSVEMKKREGFIIRRKLIQQMLSKRKEPQASNPSSTE